MQKMKPNPVITWNRTKLKQFKAEYEKHKDNRDDIFNFEGQEVLVAYAQYLIQYLEGEFNGKAHINDFVSTDS